MTFVTCVKCAALALLYAAAAPVTAQEVQPCDWQASAQSIVEPWEENSRSFANGDVRLAFLDTIEPAAGFAYLLVLSPPYAELGDRQCAVIGQGAGVGFAGLDFDSMDAGYDPAIGLIFELIVQEYDPEKSIGVRRFLTVTLNQSTGAINATLSADNL